MHRNRLGIEMYWSPVTFHISCSPGDGPHGIRLLLPWSAVPNSGSCFSSSSNSCLWSQDTLRETWDFMGISWFNGILNGIYPLVMTHIAIEHGHGNSGFSHRKWWCSTAMLVITRGYIGQSLTPLDLDLSTSSGDLNTAMVFCWEMLPEILPYNPDWLPDI